MNKRLEGKTILIVDDEEDLREIISEELSIEGAKTIHADCGHKALEVFQKNRNIDAIISDVRMPNGDANYLLNGIKECEGTKPNIFILTADSNYSDRKLLDLGADRIFDKPCNYKNLIDDLVQFLIPKQIQSMHTRKFERVNLKINVSITMLSNTYSIETQTVNISRGGMYVKSKNQAPKVNEKIQFNISYNFNDTSSTLDGVGICRWVRECAQNDSPPGFGVEFSSLSAAHLHIIETLINRKN